MPAPDLTVDELLTTTRSVRRRLDLTRPVDPALVRECLEIALQAPTGGNTQDWHWVVVTDADKRAALAELYQDAFAQYRASPAYAGKQGAGDPDRTKVQQRVATSAEHLAEHLHDVPVHVIPCIGRRPGDSAAGLASLYGSILPAAWSFMLAARSRGLGSAWTTLHLVHEKQAAEVLGIPHDEVTQCALLPVAHYTGEGFSPAPRQPLDEVLHWDGW